MSTNTQSSAAARNASRRSNGTPARRQVPHSRRTTVTLSPESQEIVERFKSANGASTSAAIDQIIQRSEPKPSRLKNVNGFLVLSTPPGNSSGARYFTVEDIKQAEDDMDGEYVERILHRDRGPARRKSKAGARR
jgi:hypothetical protein